MKFSWLYTIRLAMLAFVAVIFLLIGSISMSLAQTTTVTRYSITQLGTLGGTSSFANGINNLGQVVGGSQTASNSFVTHAFRTAPNTRINRVKDNLGTFGGPSSYANDINDLGQVVGGSDTTTLVSQTEFYRARIFRTAPNKSINPATDNLGTLNNSLFPSATGINNSGQVIGNSTNDIPESPDSEVRAFRTAANKKINPKTDDLGTLGGVLSVANDINDLGQVVGYSTSSISGGNLESSITHAFRTAANKKINPKTDDLGTLGGNYSFANSINRLGQVVGGSQVSPNSSVIHAFRTTANKKINPKTDNLGALGGDISIAYGINEDGHVVGESSIIGQPSFKTHAFLYKSNKMFDLNTLLLKNSGYTLTAANDINEKGQIAATGYINGSGAIRAFLLTPAP